jgi:hypothetical protein
MSVLVSLPKLAAGGTGLNAAASPPACLRGQPPHTTQRLLAWLLYICPFICMRRRMVSRG